MAPLSAWLARGVVAVLGADLGLRLGARTRANVGPAGVELRVEPGRAGAVIAVPPLGEVRLATHRGLLGLRATLLSIDTDRARELASNVDGPLSTNELLESFRAGAMADLRRAAARLAVRATASGIAGGAALAALTLRRPRDIGSATAISAGVLAASGAAAWASVRLGEALKKPELTGLLRETPRVLGDLPGIPRRVGRYRAQLSDLMRTTSRLHARLTALPDAPATDAIRLLHVSDLHLNPGGFDLIEALIAEYDVHAVLDTGDLVEWGTDAESRLLDRIAGFGVPYVFVRGNHDSRGTQAAVGRQPNAVVLDGAGQVEVAGVRLAGIGDPRFTPDKRTGDDHADPETVTAAGRVLAGSLAGGAADIALVHDPLSARPLAGVVPLVLAGHTHRRDARRIGDTLILVQGSTGGAGLRGVQADPPTPLTATVLYLSAGGRLLEAVDEVTVGGLGMTEVSVVRRRAEDL